MQTGSAQSTMRGVQMRAGKVSATLARAKEHQEKVLTEHVRNLRLHGAIRAGTEVMVKQKKAKEGLVACS